MNPDDRLTINQLRPMLSGVAADKGDSLIARCPAHEDRSPSLAVTQKEGRVLLHCFAGCDFLSICAALNIAPTQLSPTHQTDASTHGGDEVVYPYLDEEGRTLFEVVRRASKKFLCRRPAGCGHEYDMQGVRRVPYRLPELIAARADGDHGETVFIVEGEKDADALTSLGLTATCNPHGAGKWREEYSHYFGGLDCAIMPDNDEPGRAHARRVAESVRPIARSTRIVELPGLPEKGDVSDWLSAGGTAEELLKLVEVTAPLGSGGPPDGASDGVRHQGTRLAGLRLTPLSQLLAEPDEETPWVVEGLLPKGGFSIMSAKPKAGKSTLARNLAVCVSDGAPFLGRAVAEGVVIYLALEEKRGEVREHFKRMGNVRGSVLVSTDGRVDNTALALRTAILENRADLVIVDPLSRLLRVGDFNDYASMSRGLEGFVDLARETGTHIMALHHNRKGSLSDEDSVLGSSALFGAVDTLLQIDKRDNVRSIRSTNRYGVDLPETLISLDKSTGLVSTQGEVREVRATEKREMVLSVFDGPESLTESEIKKRVGGSGGEVSAAVRKLVHDGELLRDGTGRRGSPYTYHRSDPDVNSYQNTQSRSSDSGM